MTTNRFQPGDKVRAGIFTADIGLTPNRVYTVHHVDDFGQVQPDSARHHHYHPSHFELVMRKVWDAAATYSLKDGEGDWWFLDMAPNAVPLWRMVDRTDVVYDAEDGIEEIARDYGIDGTPTAPETYCLKDGEGDWWVSDDTEGLFQQAGYPHSQRRSAGYIESTYSIDAEPLPAVAGVAVHEPGNSTGPHLHFKASSETLAPGDRVEYVGGGTVETKSLIGKLGTVVKVGPYNLDAVRVEWDDLRAQPYSVLAENLRKIDPAPLQPGDWVKVLARVEQVYDNGSISAHTFQSDGSRNGGALYAIASAITRTDEVPEWAKERSPRDRIATLIADMGHADQSSERIADEILAQWDVTERHTEVTER